MILVHPGVLTRLAVHHGLFYNTIANQGTPEQVKYWTDKGAYHVKGMAGCFAMTEIGHGSNVAGLETTATFDPETDEFIIHSPTLTSSKFWIGGAAETVTHSTVFANLIVAGKNYGVKPFVVQLRDPQTFQLMSGITIGDIGMKMGRNEIDNGWIQFTFVRIPRTNMLMKYTQVKRDGSVEEPPISQLAYGALLFGRTSIIRESAEMAKKALTIAIRYAVCRRQFGASGASETQIMDYKTHQLRLIPLLAADYGMQLVGMRIRKEYEALLAQMDKADPKSQTMMRLITQLKEMHATSAGLKAQCTWITLDTIERCRQSLGGMGYSAYANLSAMYQDHAVQCTWEGDNTVLTLQTGRYLVSSLRDLKQGKEVAEGVAYLKLIPRLGSLSLGGRDPACPNCIQEALDVTCAGLALNAGKAVEAAASTGASLEASLEKASAQCFKAAKLHCLNYTYRTFKAAAEQAPAEIKPVLMKLCVLFGLSAVQEHAGSFLQSGFYTSKQMNQVELKVLALLDDLRSQVVPLTDAFGLSDYVINSPLGCYDGDIYRRMMDRIKESNPLGRPHPYWERTIKPMMLRKDVPKDNIQLNL